MNQEINELEVNGVKYVKKDSVENRTVETVDGMEYKIVRTYSAGVFAGYVKSRNKDEVVMIKARRLWYWDGAASLSQLSVDGVSKPENCKFPCEVDSVTLLGVIEILAVTDKAKKSIAGVKIWEQK